MIAVLALLSAAAAPPDHPIPASVLAELRLLEADFELALAQDCDASRCFSKGCTYQAHSVADRPRASSLPGLGMDLGPGSVAPLEVLTQANCAFAHEVSEDGADMTVLSRRLQSKLSSGWVSVTVGHQELLPLPPSLREPPAAPPAEAEAAPEESAPPPPPPDAARELWEALLPHFYWMLGLALATLSAVVLIWSWRRVGQASVEEQALLAELAQPAPVEVEPDAPAAEVAPSPWDLRLAEADPERPDPALAALVAELLRARELPLLAKVMLRHPRALQGALPEGGELAAARIELADFVREADARSLPEDDALFAALDRYALVASLVSKGDAAVVRSLREDFGTAGLARLIGQLPARHGALLLAMAPLDARAELVRLLPPPLARGLAEALMRSNRVGPLEIDDLLGVLRAARAGEALPALPEQPEVLDHGSPVDAAGALSALLPRLAAEDRAALFQGVLRRFNGALPAWFQGILSPEMLFALPDEARADMLLSVEVEALAAWVSLLDPEPRARLLGSAPESLRRSIDAASVFSSPARRAALAEAARQALARGFQDQLARARVPFAELVAGSA